MNNEELVYLYQNGDKQALEMLIEQNMGIIYKLINRFYVDGTNSIDKEDLEQEGIIGLITAAKQYDFNNPNKAKFVTYAVHWIYSKIHRFITSKNTNEETSLNTPIGNDGDTELMDFIEGDNYSYENIDDKLYRQQIRNELDEVMNKYNTLRERETLRLKYGWDNSSCMTFEEIGDLFNITCAKARQIEYKAIRKIRYTPWGLKKMNEYYTERFCNSNYKIDEKIKALDFKRKYLS